MWYGWLHLHERAWLQLVTSWVPNFLPTQNVHVWLQAKCVGHVAIEGLHLWLWGLILSIYLLTLLLLVLCIEALHVMVHGGWIWITRERRLLHIHSGVGDHYHVLGLEWQTRPCNHLVFHCLNRRLSILCFSLLWKWLDWSTACANLRLILIVLRSRLANRNCLWCLGNTFHSDLW
jgi:hypothetical protein